MITLFDLNRKYYNQNNNILHLISYMALQWSANQAPLAVQNLRRSQTIEPISRGFAHPSASNLYSTGVPCMKICMPKELGAHILTYKKKNVLDLKVFS